MLEQLPLPGQIWERQDGDHAGHRILVTRVGEHQVKGRTVGPRSRAPNGGNEANKVSVPMAELHRHYTLFRDTKRHARLAAREAEPVMAKLPDSLDEAQDEIARMRREGVPLPGSPERGRYLSLLARVNRREPGSIDDLDRLAVRLYTDTDVMVGDIYKALGIDANRMRRAQKLLSVPNRADIHPWRPKFHVIEGEELFLEGARPMFRKNGLMRPVFQVEPFLDEPGPLAVPEEEPVAEAEPVEQPKSARKTRHHSKPEEEAEILRLYEDPSISLDEIKQAYSLTNGGMYALLKRHNVESRTARGFKRVQKSSGAEEADMNHGMLKGARDFVERRAAAVEEVPMPASVDSNVTAIVLPGTAAVVAPDVRVIQRTWAVTYVISRVELVAASGLDEAVRAMRDKHGQDIDITSVQRT